MRAINPEHIQALLALTNRSPYYELLSKKLSAVDIGYARVEIVLQNKHMNILDSIHGGVYAALIDTAAYWSVYCGLDEQAGHVSVDLCVNNLAGIHEGKIIAEGRSIKIGRKLCTAEATVTDSTGTILAHGTSKMMIVSEERSMHHVAARMGHALPPKFIQ